jgi:hypothetical protein
VILRKRRFDISSPDWSSIKGGSPSKMT